MPNLRSYEREQLLALPAGAELDELVHGALGRMGHAPQYSKDVMLVGVMLVKLREYWPAACLQAHVNIGWILGKHQGELLANCVESKDLSRVCALALVLAAWEKE